MFDEQDRQYFYNEFKSNGYEVGSYDDFKKDLNNKEDRDWYYNEAKNMGYDVGTQADFDKMVLEPAASASPSTGGGKQVVASAHASKPQVAQPVEKPKTEYPQEVLDAYNSPDNKPGNFKDLAQLNDEYQRGVLKKPGIISQVLGMMPKVDAGNIGREQKVGGMIANMLLGDNMQQPQQTQQPQDNNQQVQQPAQQEASPESKEEVPVTAPTGVVNNEGLMDAKLANYLENWKQRPDKQGTYFENMVADLLADGTANSNEEAVSMVQSALGRYANRSAMDVTNQVVASLPDDTVQDAEKSIEAQWYSHGVQDKLKQEADSMGISYDDYVGQFLKPAMVQSLVNKYGPNYRDIAEGIATRLYSHDEHVQDRLMNQDINEVLSDVISKYTSTSVATAIQDAEAASNAQMAKYNEQSKYVDAASPFAIGAIAEANKTRDPQKILGDLQKKFGKLYRNPEFLNDMSNAAFKVMQRYGLNGTLNGDPKQFKPMINAAIKNELDQLEVKGMIPRGSADYILKTGIENTIIGKVSRKLIQTDYQNWLEDIANQQYQPGFWERVGSGALTFAGDAWSYWLPGAAGGKVTKSMLAKAEGRLASDLMAKGMEAKMAERAAKVLIGKSKGMALKTGAAHGAVTFGGQSAISKPIDEIYRTGQLDENGKVYNPSVGKILANTLGEVAKQSAVGAIMQGGTIANMVGKGRGLATNILVDVGGKVVDSSIMTGQQMLERMAQDPSFKPTGKDAAESFLESMANLTSIGLPGMMGKYARFKDAKEFNRKFDFNDRDIAELKRFGYDDLRDAFEKLGINGYRAEGEGVQMMGQLTDKYMNLMNDKSVPEVLKAKMMAVVEGKRPSSFSPVIDSEVYLGDDGKYYLDTYNKDGGVVERKEYSSHEAARKDEKKLDFEKSLNITSEYEKAYHTDALQDRLNTVYEQAREKYAAGEQLNDEDKAAIYLHQNASAIGDIMQKQQKGMELTEQEQQMVNSYRHFYDSAFENSPIMKEYVRTFEDSQGVEHGTLRKALEGDGKSRTAEQQKLVEEYQKQLYNDIVLKREMNDAKEQINQNLIEGQRELPGASQEGGASAQNAEATAEKPVDASVSSDVPPTEPPTPSVGGETPSSVEGTPSVENGSSPSDATTASNESKSDAYVMGQNAYRNGDAEGLKAIDHNDDVSKARLKRAFADNEAMMDVVVKAYEEGKDMEQFVAQRANSMTPVQQDAVRKYVEAQDAKKGVYDALQHADDGYGDALKELLWTYQTEDGNIVSATLTTGQQVFLKKANEYGGGFVVVPDEDGNPAIKQVSSAEIKEVGTPIPMDDYINQQLAEQVDARYKQFRSQFDGSGFKRGDIVSVSMEAGDEPSDVKIVGYTEDGRVILTDTDVDVNSQIDPNKLEFVTKDEFNAWRQNAIDTSIGAELDAEDAQRANDDAVKAEAEKKQRYNDGIVGLGMGQPDYSSKDTDAKVAAEYLQEQYGEDHGKLLNLVNGSRDDIKTQLANKRKAAIEYQNWLDTNADLDPEKAKKVEDELSLVNEQIADLDARFKNWNTIRNSVMTPDEVKAMKEERKAEVEKAGVDESAIVPSDDFHVLVLDDKELKKQYPTMDEATDYITSQRKELYHTQEDVERKINGVNDMLDQYINGETELDPSQLMELNTTKAQLEALQTNLSVTAKSLKAQANKLSKLYKTEVSQQEMEGLGMTPSEQRKVLVDDAFKKKDLGAIKEIYKDASVDVMDLTPQTLEEAVSEYLRPHSLNPESLQYELGNSNFKFGIGKGYDSNKFNYFIAKKGTGMSVNAFSVKVYNDLPVNLQDLGYTDQDVRNALLDMFKSYGSVKEMKNVALMNRIAAAEDELSSEEEYYEAQKEREIIERQAEIENYKSYIHEKELSLPSESELDHIYGLEFDRMMEIEDREREYKQYVKSILPELVDYDDRSNEEGYGGGSSLGSDSSRRGVDEGNSQGEEVGNGEASSESEIGEGSDSGRKGRQETGSLERGEGSAVRGSHLPQEASFGERLKSAIAETETEPTEAQKKAGNYKKGHLSFGGYDYTVETPKGVTRSGKDEQGKPWSVTMHDTYGYILGKIGVDGDHIDMFINDAADLDTFDGNVYVVDQVNSETGEFDEHKVMYGYPSEEAATEAYLANYSKGWKGLGKVTSVPKATFDKWLESSDRKTKPFAEYAMVQKEQRAAYEEEMMQDGAHSEAFDKIVELAKEQKEYWDLMEQGEVDPDDVPEVDVAHEMDELLKTLSDEEFKEVSDVLENLDEEFEYWTANEHERREDLAERKNAAAYSEFLKQETKSIAPFADALRTAVNSGDKKAIAKAQKELTDALLTSNLGHGYLSGQLEYAKSAKKKDESYSERRAFIKPLTGAINAIESALDSALADVGLEGVHVDFKEYGYGWIYADKGSDWRDRLEPLDNDYRNVSQYSDVNPISVLPQITMNNVKKVAGIIKSRIEEGKRYNSDENQDENIEEAKKAKDNLPFHRDVKEVKPSDMTEAQKVAYDAVSTMLKKAGIPVKVVSNEDMEKVAEAQDNLNLAMLLNHPKMRFKIKTPEEKQADENAYNFAKELRPNKWAQYAVVGMSNPNKMPEYFEKQELARKERSYYNKLMWGNYKVFNLNKSFEDNVAGLTGSFPSEFNPYKIDEQTNKRNELKKQMKETEEAYKSTGQERMEYQNQLMKEYMDEHGLASENDIPDDIWNDCRVKSFEKYQDNLDSLFAKYKDLDRQLKAVAEPGVQYLKGKGVVYGYTDGKEIVLNQEHLNANTPIHEYQHLWRTAAKEMNPGLIEHGDKLIMQTQLFADLKEDSNYKHLSDDEICDEAFARLTGEDGAAILEQMAKDAIKENPLDTAKELTIINRLKNWLKEFWYWTLDTFTKWKPEDIKKMTLEDIRNLVLRDLANGVDPRTKVSKSDITKENVELEEVNKTFNQRLDELVKNPNQKDKILRLGRSSSFLKAGGVADAEIELEFDKFIRMSGDKYKNNHPFAASDLKNLPMALAEPIAVFNSTTANDHVVLTELQKDGKNFIVAVRAVEQHRKGGVVLEVNKITSLYPKEERGIVYWINNGRISNVDKEKALHFIEALQPHAGTTITDEELKSAANIINSFETTKGKGKKFSLEDPKTLAGVHNISEEKLLKAIKQGGLANPSVAVIDTSKQDHKAYGGISLILPSDKIAKRTGKNAGTWQGDAYTPTYPEVEKQMSNKGAEKSSSDVLSVPKEMQHEVRNGIDRWLNGGDANSGLKYLFLHEKGNAPKMVELQHKYSDKVYNDLKSITSGNFDISSIGKADAQKVLDMYIDNVFGGDRAAYEEKQKYRIARYKKQVAEGEKNPFLLVRAKNALEQYDKYGFYLDKVQEFVRKVERDHRMTGVDTNATLNDVEDYIKTNNLTDEFNIWLEGKEKEYGIKEVIFDGFTPSGNRRYVPNTLENVSKLMKKQGRNGATGAAVSFQNFAARLMPTYGTLKDIRSKKGLLTSDREKFDKFRDKWSSVFFELGNKCQPDSTSAFDSYGMERLSEAAMTSDPQAYLKKEYNVDFSDADTKRLKDMVKAIKEEHPAMYFETKFERPVRFDEFSAAVVPTTTKKEVKEALKNAGVSIFEYEEKSDADRKRAFNEAINSNNEIRFHRVTEPEELDRLNKEKTFRMYSGMQEVDGKLYSPMAAIIDGKRTDATEIGAWMGADERPDLVKGGKFQLVKTDKNPGAGEGPVRAAYNPYMHTSTSMMNDQFTGAYARGNIKVVEWEIPESEKTSGYRAEGAKDAVGLVPWHSGSVNGLLPKDRQRSVMLSRWRKAVRVVPDSEVAESIAEQLDGTGLAIPWNVVTPNQLRELVKLGVPITTDESGQQAPETKEKFLAQMEELRKEFPQAQFVNVKMTKDAFKEWGKKAHVKARLVESFEKEKARIASDAKGKGSYMLAPNGKKSKLDAEQWATVRTTNFKKWFGDWENDPENASKVVDENGEPMVVYHGRSADFNTFEKKEGVRFIMGLEDKVKAEGFFFSPDRALAEEFAGNAARHRGGKANVVPCYLNIRKPMDLTGEDYDRIYEDVTGWDYTVGMDTQDNLWGIMDEEGMADKIKAKGYDGAIFVEEVDDNYEPTKISYCALDANQIKSADKNNGEFSSRNNDIRFRFAEPYDYEKYPLGRVEPNLATKEVKIVHTDANHGFKDYKEAKNWAIGNICRTYTSDETGNKGEVIINKDVVSKYVSKAARDQSDNDDVHYAVLKVLPDVIREGIEAETHPNFNKVGNARKPEYGYDNHLLIHRVYGAVDIDGVVYRVKITMKENMQDRSLPNKPYSYEVTDISTKIEPLEAIDAQVQDHGSHSNDSISGTNLLKKVEMSYDNGKKLLDESEKMGISIENQRKIADSVVNTANKLGGAEATVYSSLDDVPEEYRSEVEQGAKGWYDPETHTVHVYLPNCEDGNDAQRTVFHEKIGHEGMEVLLGGEDGVRKFANFVYRSVGKDVRGKIIDFANKYDPDWKNNDRMNVGTQEYIAHLAEEGPKTAEDFSLWTKIKHYLIKVLKKLGVRVPGLLNDKDLRYYLMKAGKALHVWDEMPQEKQEALMKQASNAEIKDALSDGAGKGKPRQKKGESAIQYMKRVQEWRKWQNAREDENDPEPPMFYDIDKDEAGKKEWARLNKDWRERHHLAGEEPTGMPIRMEGEEDGAYMTRIHEYEKWKDAMKDQKDPMPDMFAFEKKKQEEVKRKYEDWLARHELLEQQQADLDLYEGKIYPAETKPKADALEQQVMQDLAEVTSTDVSKEGAAMTVKHAVIHRRKNMEEASADDAIYINDVKNRIEKMADSGAFDKLLSDYQGKPNKAEKLAEAIPYIIEAPRRLRDLAHDLNATGAFDKGHIHIQPADVEAIQPFVADLIAETGKKHTELKDGKEVEVYDDPQAVSEVASKMAQAINANHQGEEGFVPIDGSDIMSEHVLPLVMQQIVPDGIDYKNLSPEMKATLDSIRDWYNYTYDWLKDNRTLKEDTGYNADYVNHIWDKEKSDKQAYAMYVENRQRTKSPNEKPRTISTLMEGISVGLVPKTTDITKMMAYYSRSNIEAWVNKTMLQELSGLNVIERNEDGEIISSDPLLSSTPPFNLEQYKYFEIPGVGPVWVYNVSPKQVKVKNPITGKERVLYSEASAGDRFGVVFETYQSSPFWKAFDTLASSAKKLELGFSGFHAGALTEVYMVQNMVEFGPKKAMANFMKYIFADTMKNHELPCFANPQDFQEAASHLVKFGATNDYAAADVQNMFDNMRDAMMKVQEKLKDGNGISGTVALATMPLKVATQMLSLINKGMDRALWDFLHDGLKLATYRMRADKTKERAKKKGWTEEELSRALDEDGQFVNDMFGGQHWDIVGASQRTIRIAGRCLLSPDWNKSTTSHFLAITGFGSVWNEATFENFKQYYQRLWHKELIPEDEGRRSRQISSLLCYGIGFMVFYEAIANGINAAFRAMDEEKERKKAEEIRKTNPSYKSMYELAYPDGMKWYDYLMRGNSLGQQSKIFLGRYADGTEMYIRHGKQFREVPEYLFNHKGELEFPGPMVQRMIGKANPMMRMTLDDINYLSDFQASHADQEIQRKYGKTIGLLYKDALYWAPFLIPSQENKEFKAVDFFFPSSKGFSPWKAQSYFKDFILSGDMEGVVMTYQSCQRNGIDPEAQIKAAIGSVKALESAEMQDGVTSLQEASKRFDAAKSITEKKKMRQKMKKFLSQSEYKAFTQKEALDMVQGYLNGDEDLKEMEKAESKYLMKAKAEDVTEDWRIQNVWNGTVEAYQEYQRLKDVDKAKANAFKNSKTNKRLFAARKAISAAKKKMNKAKKQMDGQNDAAKLVEIRKTRKELLETLNGME